MKNTDYDLIGIGIGPSNLSTAALMNPYKSELNTLFIDAKQTFKWHPGMMFEDAKLQVSVLKDLVTMIDPTSKFSFLNYLNKKDRLYMFASKNGFSDIKRSEFEDYCKWVISQMENMEFGQEAKKIRIVDDVFELTTSKGVCKTKNIVMGVGLKPNIPEYCKNQLSDKLFHSSQFLLKKQSYAGKEIAIIGGGQSSCEIVESLLRKPSSQRPSKIKWIFKEQILKGMENTPFDNDFYTPTYSDYYYNLDNNEKKRVIESQKYTSDGISEETIKSIYDLLYTHNVRGEEIVEIYNQSLLINLQDYGAHFELFLNNDYSVYADNIILCTGYCQQIPELIQHISDNFVHEDGVLAIDEHYKIQPVNNQLKGSIYLHNGVNQSRGIANPNLSLLARRSAIILNSLLQREVYEIKRGKSMINWNARNSRVREAIEKQA